jgi:hypothetical protein
MKKASLAIAAGVSILLAVAPLPAGQNGANGEKVECWQSAAAVTQVAAGVSFELRATGFKSDLPVWACISMDVCVLSQIDPTGSFTQQRTLQAPGTYTVTITQARNRQLDTWVLRAQMPITVTN